MNFGHYNLTNQMNLVLKNSVECIHGVTVHLHRIPRAAASLFTLLFCLHLLLVLKSDTF